MKVHVLVCGLSFLKLLKLLNQDWWLLKMFVESFQRQHMAIWNNVSGVWVTDQVNLLCAHSVLFLETWPASGMTLSGRAFELPMPAHPTTVSGSSSSPSLPTIKARDSIAEGYEAGLRRAMPQIGTIAKGIADGDDRVLLRSPKASEGQGGALGEAEALKRGNTVGVRDQVMDLVASQGLKVSRVADNLLPTPNTMEHREIKTPEQIAELKAKSPGGYRNLRESVINDLLPTPIVNQGRNATSSRQPDSKHHTGHTLQDLVFDGSLLPTPIVRDYKDGSSEVLRDGEVQTDTVARAIFNSGEVLLGTPRTSSANASTSKQIDAGAPKSRLEDQVELPTTSWGKFEPAITRWEQVLGRPAPSPTKPDGKDGSHRLSSVFTEWMMGLPEGWITGVGLTRVEELKACGNGVVPQQAELALRMLLDGFDFEKDEN